MESNKTTHILLFFLTFLSLTYSDIFLNPEIPQTLENYKLYFFENWPYSVSLLFILLAHEMGHYLPARYYGVRASLPYFIPLPFGPIGTMGAVIKINDQIPNKKVLFDIGVGGPAVSLVLSIVVWIIGISISKVVEIPTDFNRSGFLIFGDSAFTYFSSQWILGPIDFATTDIQAHPLAKAGWVGLLVTAINLLPFGQLDGGHVIYSMFGESYRKWIHVLFGFFLIFALVHFTWLIWGFLIYYVLKVEHPFIKDAMNGIGKTRFLFGILILVSFLVIFVPKPMTIVSAYDNPTLLDDLFRLIVKTVGISD
ncbi:site-2 protease family protein [Leptospira paudalimensis]|uniref:Site-2 protease family protein n=1 Tax=Leptospira paudalimensis TaxID=2950024 RepID=A0ABT3MB97_9LEPT|nr:site-2 protease family protein [Leptospira paudalimensis]MCW7505668.1 site-2 protease family protein [Leptospira paudalimensis]